MQPPRQREEHVQRPRGGNKPGVELEAAGVRGPSEQGGGWEEVRCELMKGLLAIVNKYGS